MHNLRSSHLVVQPKYVNKARLRGDKSGLLRPLIAAISEHDRAVDLGLTELKT